MTPIRAIGRKRRDESAQAGSRGAAVKAQGACKQTDSAEPVFKNDARGVASVHEDLSHERKSRS